MRVTPLEEWHCLESSSSLLIGFPPLSPVPSISTPLSEEYSVQFSSVQSLSRVWLFVTPRTAARQASLSITSSRRNLSTMRIWLSLSSYSKLFIHFPLSWRYCPNSLSWFRSPVMIWPLPPSPVIFIYLLIFSSSSNAPSSLAFRPSCLYMILSVCNTAITIFTLFSSTDKFKSALCSQLQCNLLWDLP